MFFCKVIKTVPQFDYPTYLLCYLQYIETKMGYFIDIDTGKIVGEHGGLHKWTVGQRTHMPSHKDALFVYKKDLVSNNIYVVNM